MLRTAGLQVAPFDPAASSDEDSDLPGYATVVSGLGVPGLNAIGLVAATFALLLGQLLGRTPGRR